MDSQYISEYFLKATALVLASAGIESVEKQALHVLAKEAERYAQELGKHASRLAEAGRRSQLTSADIKAAAMMISPQGVSQSLSHNFLSSESKRRLRSSVETHEVVERRAIMPADFDFPQILTDTTTSGDERSVDALNKKIQSLPPWVQREYSQRVSNGGSKQTDQRESAKSTENRRLSLHTEPSKDIGPLSYISSLVLAEEESRAILTKKTRLDSRESSSAN